MGNYKIDRNDATVGKLIFYLMYLKYFSLVYYFVRKEKLI